MIHSIKSNNPNFKCVTLHSGFNVILADRNHNDQSENKKTRNGAGKTTLVEIIHFCLGSQVTANSVFKNENLKGWSFILELDIANKIYNIERFTDSPGKIYIDGDVSTLSFDCNQSITLFENKSQAFTISNISQKIILPIVLTLNQFGSIAVNTSQLIQTEDNQPYPWVCNLHDMENIIEINTYLNKGPSNFIDYILWRINNHAHIYSSDELDVLENYYLNNKATIKITNSDTIIMPNGPSLIDKIYFEKHGIPYTLPAMEKKPVRRTKVGRKELCPCGSGIKFKKCCIRKGIYD